MNGGQLLKNAVKNFKTRYVLKLGDMIRLVDKHKFVILTEKYQNKRLISGYNNNLQCFFQYQAPWGRSFSDWELLKGIDHLDDCREEKFSFDDAEYWAIDIKPLTKFQKFYLKYFKGIK